MHTYFVILGVLGVWRVTHLLSEEAGPSSILTKLRRALGTGFWGQLADCFYCLSLWVAAAFALGIGKDWMERGLLWPALSGAAIVVERLTDPRPAPWPGLYTQEPEEEHVLRKG